MDEVIRLYDRIKESFLLLDFGDRRFLGQFDLSTSRYYLLHHVADRPGLSPSELSNYMFCDKSNITRLLKGLERDNLVERRPHEQDGRAIRLYLTEAGAALYREANRAHEQYVRARLAGIDPESGERLSESLEHLNLYLGEALYSDGWATTSLS